MISKTAKLVQSYLDELEIEYIKEHSFEDLTGLNGGQLRFDYWLPEAETIIEINGRQHYEFVEYFHKDTYGFELYKYHDDVKQRYCEDNGIMIIVIPYYYEGSIPDILDDLVFIV